MKILDGKKASQKIADKLRQQIFDLFEKPKLVILQVGDIRASDIYVSRKIEFADDIGAIGIVKKFPNSVSTEEIASEIEDLNNDSSTHGMIVQLPLPAQIDVHKILNSITPEKDVDGLSDINLEKVKTNESDGIVPATARGIIELLKINDIEIRGKSVAIVGSSLLGGQTISQSFINNGGEVSVYDITTEDVPGKTRQADILVSAVGKAGLITAEYVHENQIVVDAGISVSEEAKVRGDVVEGLNIGAITPVPGGVGPMTISSLFQNLLDAHEMQKK